MFRDRLWASIDDIWRRILRHPFLTELHRGTLARERFAYFLGQDYAYLEDFARVLALGAARSPSGAELRLYLGAAAGVFAVEQELHATLTGVLGGDPAALARTPRGPATRSYLDFLLRHGFAGDYLRLVAAVLPCFWIYREVGLRLKNSGLSPDPVYAAWIDTYAGEPYGAAVEAQLRIADRLGAENPGREGEFCAIFREGVAHELDFWHQAYRLGR